MMYGYDGYNCGGYGIFGGWHFIIPLIIIGIVIYAVYKLITSNNSQMNNNSFLDELNRKFVSGELSEDEYLRKKQIINKK